MSGWRHTVQDTAAVSGDEEGSKGYLTDLGTLKGQQAVRVKPAGQWEKGTDARRELILP